MSFAMYPKPTFYYFVYPINNTSKTEPLVVQASCIDDVRKIVGGAIVNRVSFARTRFKGVSFRLPGSKDQLFAAWVALRMQA